MDTRFFYYSRKMAKFILGKKLGMTTIYEKGKALNVTLIECEPNKVSLIRTQEKDGYNAVQLQIKKKKDKVYKKEFRLDGKDESFTVDQEIAIDIFELGEKVKVSGVTKAKGFQGVVKRHGFKGAPKTHGHKHDLRAPGSIGSGWPQHVIKGMRMAGRMGGVKSSVRNVKVVYLNKENNLVGIKGAVPGVAGRTVEIIGIKQ